MIYLSLFCGRPEVLQGDSSFEALQGDSLQVKNVIKSTLLLGQIMTFLARNVWKNEDAGTSSFYKICFKMIVIWNFLANS